MPLEALLKVRGLVDRVVRFIASEWHSPIALVLLLFVSLILSIEYFSKFEFRQIDLYEWLLIALLLGVIAYIWLATTHLKKIPKGKIGFVIAINAEEEEHRKKMQADFVGELRRAISGTPTPDNRNFFLLELPRWHSSQITDTDSARKYMRKCRANFLVFGTARIRLLNGAQTHVLRLQEIVAHRAVPKEVSAELSKEMTEIFPGAIHIGLENDLIGLEITSQWLAEASIYFIAVAALISGDPILARELLATLRKSKRLSKIRKVPGVSQLRRLIPMRLSDAYATEHMYVFAKWRKTRDSSLLDEAKKLIERAHSLHARELQYHLALAIWYFVCKGQPKAALAEALKCRRSGDPTWRYSAAFLEAFTGNLDSAIKYYEKAFKRMAPGDVVFQVEDFLTWVLSTHPEKYQLLFCRGLLNMKAIGDEISAVSDFEEFLSAEKNGEFPEGRRLAEIYVAQLKACVSI